MNGISNGENFTFELLSASIIKVYRRIPMNL